MNKPTTADLNKFPKFSVIPVNGKVPLIRWEEYTKRLPTSLEKQEWQKLFPGKDIGIVTGEISGLFVLDVDGEEGAATLHEFLTSKDFSLPKTPSVKTPNGRHFYFRWISELENKITTKAAILGNVDVRGNGGYCKFYGWETSPNMVPLARPPQWLIDLLPNKQERVETIPKQEGITNNDWLAQQFEGLKEGNRNDTFTRIAGSLRSRGYSPNEIFVLLQGKAKEVNFQDLELRTICSSVGRYEPRIVSQGNASSIDAFLEDIQKVEWIVEPIIARQTLGFIAGLPETGKTWIAIDLAIECARGGGMWLGKFPVKAAKVLFIDQERFKGETQRRFKAVISAKSLDLKSLKSTLFVRCGTTTRLDLQVSYDAFRKEVAEIRPDLVIVDSFVTFHNSDENNRQSIQIVLERIKQIRNEFGCTFLFVDHEAKGAFQDKDNDNQPSIIRIAGSIAKPAAAELVLTVRRQDSESSMVYMTKSTLAQGIPPFLIKIEGKEKINVTAY